MLDYMKNSQNKILEQVSNFYTPYGIQVYFKDQLMNPELDVERVVSKLERLIPKHLLSEIEMIIIGYFEEFEEKEISAFYKDGTLNISNFIQDEEELLEHYIKMQVGLISWLKQCIKQDKLVTGIREHFGEFIIFLALMGY